MSQLGDMITGHPGQLLHNRGRHVALAVGVEVPLTDMEYDYRIRTFLLWDIADGPFWVGW